MWEILLPTNDVSSNQNPMNGFDARAINIDQLQLRKNYPHFEKDWEMFGFGDHSESLRSRVFIQA